MNPNPIEQLATVFFGLAVLHTFCVKRFAQWAEQFPEGSVRENLLHFLAETEVVFGLWAAALFLGIAALKGSFHPAVACVESLNFTEPKFVFVIMVVAAATPPTQAVALRIRGTTSARTGCSDRNADAGEFS